MIQRWTADLPKTRLGEFLNSSALRVQEAKTKGCLPDENAKFMHGHLFRGRVGDGVPRAWLCGSAQDDRQRIGW